jgi:hypothetical protein
VDTVAIEHKPWVGSLYKTVGINGKRIAIVGHSHWGDDCTIKVVSHVITGEYKIWFFSSIRNYFGFSDNADFWNRVMFFNYLPHSVGTEEQRYNSGTKEQIERAKTRLLRILAEEPSPQKVFVFTDNERMGKGWSTFPETREEEGGNSPMQLGAEFGKFSWGTYHIGDHIVMAFGLRHPQGASGKQMRHVVQHILALPLIEK